ncbi:hypothetical protein G9A89_007367 [Geosiphon pyriformis]|nr:hypothetical protein G9A89_007367 [Geosiphon pyriformis]
MGDYALSTSSIETKKAIWRPLLSTIRCIQVPLIEVPSVLDLYMFDTVSLGGGSLCNGYKILDHDCIHKKRVREGDVKAITLVNEDANKNSNSKLAYVEYLGCSNRRLPLILVINVTGISTINEKTSLQNKDLPEEINFPKGNQITKQRYRLMGVSFCNDIHHIADVRFENVKNSGWYQYDGLQKTYKVRAMAIGSSRPPPKSGYTMDFYFQLGLLSKGAVLTCLSNKSITRLNFPFKVVPLSLVDFTVPSIGSALKRGRCS